MDNELISLTKNVKFILEEREMPIEIKNMVESIFQEYRSLYEKNMKGNEIALYEQYVALKNVDEYFEENFIQVMRKINNEYKEKCMDKAEIITMIISTLEPKDDKNKDTEIEESEKDVLNKCIINSKENHLYIEHITNYVIDSIENSKNEWFRILESLRTSHQKKEYIYGQIKLIENSAKLKIGGLKELLEIDDRRIFDEIMSEYEQYKQNNGPKSEHQKFAKELQKNVNVDEKKAMQAVEDREEIEKKSDNPLLDFTHE